MVDVVAVAYSILSWKHFKKVSINISEDYAKFDWVRHPLSGALPNELGLKESFINLTEDSSMKDSFKEKSLVNFWIESKPEYPMLFLQALQLVMLFVTCYLCEIRFSELLYIKINIGIE